MRLFTSTPIIIKKSLPFILCVLLILSTFIISGMSGSTPNEEYLTKIDSELYEYMQNQDLVDILIRLDPIIKQTCSPEIAEVRDPQMAAVDSVRQAIKDINRKYSSSGELSGQPISEEDRIILATLREELDNKRSEMRAAITAKMDEVSNELTSPIKTIIETNGGRIILNTAYCGWIDACMPGIAIIELADSLLIRNIYKTHEIEILPALDTSAYSVNADDFWVYEEDNCFADVAVLDTGVWGGWVDIDEDNLYDQNEWIVNHEDLYYKYNSEVREWYSVNFVGYHDYNNWQPGNLSPVTTHHGTMVAGIIGSSNSTYRGLASSIHKIINARVTGPSLDDLIAACEWACGYPKAWQNDSNYFHLYDSAEVINLSVGWSGRDDEEMEHFIDVINELSYECDVLFVSAVGNANKQIGDIYPDEYGNNAQNASQACNSIGVGATDDKDDSDRFFDTIPDYSNWGPTIGPYEDLRKPDLVAPGGDDDYRITSTGLYNPPSYDGWDDSWGTSFAAPHVSAAAAMLMGNDALSAGEAKGVLINTAGKQFNELDEQLIGCSYDWSGLWDTKAGWGYMNLADAIYDRNYTAQISSSGMNYYYGTLYAGETITIVNIRKDQSVSNGISWIVLKDEYGTQIDGDSSSQTVLQVYTDTTYTDMVLSLYYNSSGDVRSYIVFPNDTWQ